MHFSIQRTFAFTLLAVATAVADAHEPAVGATKSQHADLANTPYLLKSGDGNVVFEILAYRKQQPENLALAEMELAPGIRSDLHRHHSAEWIYVIEGQLTQFVAGREEVLNAGDLSIVEPTTDVVHEVTSEIPARFLIFWHPADEVDRLLDGGLEIQRLPAD